MKYLLSISFIMVVFSTLAQYRFFDHPERMELVRRGGDFIYNLEEDSAGVYIEKVRAELPDHPIVPLMEGLQVLWLHVPVLDSVFEYFITKMNEAVELSEQLEGGINKNDEALFFALAARGLMAEYYADVGQYMRAVSEANKAYGLVKRGFEKTDEINEFLFTSGLYNYFRVKYPEINPVYRPFVWLFKSGDKKLGLEQLDEATRNTIISRIEANIYISYIYLRYEDTPEKAQEYLSFLIEQYPRNDYLVTKYLESLRADAYFDQVPIDLIERLQHSDRKYMQLAGFIFKGLYVEKVLNKPNEAVQYYGRGIDIGKQLPNHGEFYKSLGYLAMGRILQDEKPGTAREYLKKSLEFAETKDIKKEARALLRSE